MEKRRSDDANDSAVIQPASFWRRLMSMLYDLPVVVVLWMLATAIAMAMGMENRTAGKDPWYTVGLLLIWFGYLGWSWTRGGMTLGMRAWKLRIETSEGKNPDWSRCLLRFALSGLSWAAAGLGYLWMLIDRDGLTWHDRLSQTRIVQAAAGTKPNVGE